MSLTSSSHISTSSPGITGTSSATTIPTDPAWLGWLIVQNDLNSGTPVYSPGSCGTGSTFVASSTLAACCGTSAPCTVFSSCTGGTALVDGNKTSICGALSTCKTDYVYQTAINGVETSPTVALYCGTGLSGAAWFRSMPTPGIALSSVPTSSTQSGNGLHWGGIGGGIGGGIFFITLLAFGCCLVRSCGGRRARSSGSRYPSRPSGHNNYPMDDFNQNQRDQFNRYLEDRSRQEDYDREQANQQAEQDRQDARRTADEDYRNQQIADDQAYRNQQN